MTVTISLDSRDAFDALPDVFFWPVPMSHLWCNVHDRHPNLNCRPGPDPEWVKAGEPCRVCDGSGDETMDSMLAVGVPGGQFPIGPCLDCIDGKPRIAITVPCPFPATESHPHGGSHRGNPRPCDVNGRVVVPDVWAVIEHGPLPIVDPDTAGRDSNRPVVVIYEGCKYAYLESRRTPQYGDTAIDLGPDPASLVGTFGVVCKVVSR